MSRIMVGYLPSPSHSLNSLRTSCASRADRSDPSPSLFSACKAGNSHSNRGTEEVRGLERAAWIAWMARVSRS